MEGRREDVETFPCHFSSAVSSPHDVESLSQVWSLAKVDGPQP